MIIGSRVSSEDFLEDVKLEIKRQFKNQDGFAETVHISRKCLNRILNNADELTIYWINKFCDRLGLDLRNYIFDQILGTQVLFCTLFWDKTKSIVLNAIKYQRRKAKRKKK